MAGLMFSIMKMLAKVEAVNTDTVSILPTTSEKLVTIRKERELSLKLI